MLYEIYCIFRRYPFPVKDDTLSGEQKPCFFRLAKKSKVYLKLTIAARAAKNR
jgi:hypothetical protein